MTVIRVRAPASSANLGPAFDCAAVALDLWNELEVRPRDTVSQGTGGGAEHLGVRAFALLAPPEEFDFTWRDAVPRERGLGSSAAVVALGLVAGARAVGRAPDPEELLALGLELEGHGDNLAPALAGGVCLTWGTRIRRVAKRAPATPIALVTDATMSTAAARAALPATVSHADAAHTAGRAALLGAALASASAELFAEALDDRLHEPYRAVGAPLLAAVRAEPPRGAVGATLSGSGPSVIVWALDDAVDGCVAELEARFPQADVVPLPVVARGAVDV